MDNRQRSGAAAGIMELRKLRRIYGFTELRIHGKLASLCYAGQQDH